MIIDMLILMLSNVFVAISLTATSNTVYLLPVVPVELAFP